MLCIKCCEICFCVLLLGHYRCALLICGLKKMFRHQNLVLTVRSGWQVWIKRTALICCRNGLKVCARKCSCAGKMNSLRPAHGAAEMPHWPSCLLFLLTTGWPQYRDRFWLDCFTSSPVVKWWLLTYAVMLIAHKCPKQLPPSMSFYTVHLFISRDCIDRGSWIQTWQSLDTKI